MSSIPHSDEDALEPGYESPDDSEYLGKDVKYCAIGLCFFLVLAAASVALLYLRHRS